VTAREILGETITADKLNVSNLNAINATSTTLNVTGALVIGSSASPGKIMGGKTAYSGTGGDIAGFFLGYETGYKFSIGDSASYLKWNGTDLLLRTKQALVLQADPDDKRVLQFTDYLNRAGSLQYFTYDWNGVAGQPPVFTLPVLVKANYFEANNIKFSDPSSAISKETIIWDFAGSRESLSYYGPTHELVFTGPIRTPSLVLNNLTVDSDRMYLTTALNGITGGSAGGAGMMCWGWDSGSATWNIYVFCPDGPPGSPTWRWRRAILNRM